MSDTFKGLMVILDEDHKNGDRIKFISAIRMMKGVSDVHPIDTEGFHDILIKKRTLATIQKAFNELILKMNIGQTKLVD